MTLKSKTAVPGVGPRNGGELEKLHGASCPDKYSGRPFSAIPSTERPDLMARVVASGGKLYAVGYHVAGAQ